MNTRKVARTSTTVITLTPFPFPIAAFAGPIRGSARDSICCRINWIDGAVKRGTHRSLDYTTPLCGGTRRASSESTSCTPCGRIPRICGTTHRFAHVNLRLGSVWFLDAVLAPQPGELI